MVWAFLFHCDEWNGAFYLKRKERADEDQKEMTPFHSYSSQIYEKKKREKTTTFHAILELDFGTDWVSWWHKNERNIVGEMIKLYF